MITEQKKAPVQTLRDGAMFVKLWEQQGSKGPYVTATTGRTFKNEQTGEYLLAHPMLAEHLTMGLEQHGYECG